MSIIFLNFLFFFDFFSAGDFLMKYSRFALGGKGKIRADVQGMPAGPGYGKSRGTIPCQQFISEPGRRLGCLQDCTAILHSLENCMEAIFKGGPSLSFSCVPPSCLEPGVIFVHSKHWECGFFRQGMKCMPQRKT